MRFALLFMALAITSAPAAPIDCPLRDAPYSRESPLIDILLKPEAKAVLEREAPAMLARLSPGLRATTPPSFGAITTLKRAMAQHQVPPEAAARIDKALAALTVTDADRIARCARYDVDDPKLKPPPGKPRLLVFEKITGFRDDASVKAAHDGLLAMAARRGWAMVATDRGGAINPEMLGQFDAVIWNNVSGDVLTLSQRAALKAYIEGGGGFVGVHGSGGDSDVFWEWYARELIGARFIGHPMKPQFQPARVIIKDDAHPITRGLAPGWTMADEWYSFDRSPRESGATILAWLDETSYSPNDHPDAGLTMGEHPIAWTRCVGEGRAFYTAIGHHPDASADPHNARFLEQAITWAADASGCGRASVIR